MGQNRGQIEGTIEGTAVWLVMVVNCARVIAVVVVDVVVACKIARWL